MIFFLGTMAVEAALTVTAVTYKLTSYTVGALYNYVYPAPDVNAQVKMLTYEVETQRERVNSLTSELADVRSRSLSQQEVLDAARPTAGDIGGYVVIGATDEEDEKDK
eukprot:TRINITY_DN889_c1_g2_i2.p1 TRINITY_DN889_c1_g2~~TRINITY_DN889_c1_g2_i2.p1  ORF type:complete len:108 (+),score=17.18 TRINITY_DN889_c1_g2_i2:553-876(+)